MIITTILDFLLMTWVFWPIIIALPFTAYYCVTSAVKDDEGEIFASILIAGIVGALAYKYPAVRGYFDGWRAIATVVGGYLVAGFLLSLYKWFTVLWDFRKQDIKKLVDDAKSYVAKDQKKDTNSVDEEFTGAVIYRLVGSRFGSGNEKLNVEFDKAFDQFSVYPNWKKYPIGTWWVYWPFFLLELPFDWVKRIAERLFNWLRHFYNGLAQRFAVKV